MQMKMVTNVVSVALLLSGACAVASDSTNGQNSLLKNPKVKTGLAVAGVAAVGYYTYTRAFGKNELDEKRSARMKRQSDADVKLAHQILEVGNNDNVTPAELRALEGVKRSAVNFATLKRARLQNESAQTASNLKAALDFAEKNFKNLLPDDFANQMRDKAKKLDGNNQTEIEKLTNVLNAAQANNNAQASQQEVEVEGRKQEPKESKSA